MLKKNNTSIFKYSIALVLLLILGSCNLDDEKEIKIENLKEKQRDDKTAYAKEFKLREKTILDSLQILGLLDLNDTAKWYLYNLYSSYGLPKSIERSKKDTIYLSYLPLRVGISEISNDNKTIQLLYNFLYSDSVRVQNFKNDEGTPSLAAGVTLDIKTKKVINYIVHLGSFTIDNDVTRVTADKLLFIQKNKGKLNPWYKNELERHNILFED